MGLSVQTCCQIDSQDSFYIQFQGLRASFEKLSYQIMTDKPVDTSKRYPSHGFAVLARRIWPFLCLLLIAGCSSKVKFTDKSRSGPIVILGDSLSEAYQLKPEFGFVALLGERLDVEIVNLGKKGNTTGESVPRVKEEVLPLKPSLVIIQLGGNDVLQKVDPAETRANFQKMIDEVHQESIPILLLGVRGGLMSDKFEDMFSELVSQNELAYVPDILDGILTSPGLRIDNIHPNKEGHILIADRVEPELKKLVDKLGLKK
jgi:acyl-CoA thioesterase-1